MSKLSSIVMRMLGLLEEYEFIISSENSSDFQSADSMFNNSYKATPIGKRVAELYIDPLTAHDIIEAIKKSTINRERAFDFFRSDFYGGCPGLDGISSYFQFRPFSRVAGDFGF